MSLDVGTKLGPYEIAALIGVGGMGEVYRATDTKLGRAVAIKVLPDELAQHNDRRARFQREAQLLASLNHQNIAAIYGLEESSSTHYLVLELVEGDDLSERIARGPIPVEEAIDIARQIAEGLEVAHDKGVVHRDLKPGNIKLAPDGQVKVLDFGLAKVWVTGTDDDRSSDLSQSPTMARASTEAGVILGTVSYMAPEQARGKSVDRRADIWAFGAVLWEMLTGHKLFEGETASDVVAAVLTREPDWDALPATTPPAIRQLLRRTLERDVRRRLQAIGEARLVLEQPGAATVDAPPADAPTASRAPRRTSLVLVAGALALFAAGWLLRSAPANEAPVRKVDLSIGEFDSDLDLRSAISPDGSHLVYLAGGRLHVRDLASFEAVEVAESEGATYPFWSPDGSQLAFVARGRAWKVAIDGSNAPSDLGPVPKDLLGSGGGAWTDDGHVVLAGSSDIGLWQLPAVGGEGTDILPLEREAEADFHEIAALPDNRGLIFTVHRTERGFDAIDVLAAGTRRELLSIAGENLRHPLYSPTGHLIYERETTNPGLWAAPFSLERLEVTGAPFLVIPGARAPSLGGDALAMVRANESPVELVWRARNGAVESVAQTVPSRYRSGRLSLSPDGRRVAMNLRQPNGHLWVHDLARNSSTLLASGMFEDGRPVWMRAGDRVLYGSSAGARSWNLSSRRADAAGDEERISTSIEIQIPLAVSPDGEWLVYSEAFDMFKRPLEGSGEGTPFVVEPSDVGAASFSPDGRWIAYASSTAGGSVVNARLFPEGDKLYQVASSGDAPVWGKNGDIFFFDDDGLVSVAASTSGDELELSTPELLFEVPSDVTAFDVTPDGRRFLMLRSTARERVSLIFNWPAELARIAGEQAAGAE